MTVVMVAIGMMRRHQAPQWQAKASAGSSQLLVNPSFMSVIGNSNEFLDFYEAISAMWVEPQTGANMTRNTASQPRFLHKS